LASLQDLLDSISQLTYLMQSIPDMVWNSIWM
jgi:hypothetical protein